VQKHHNREPAHKTYQLLYHYFEISARENCKKTDVKLQKITV